MSWEEHRRRVEAVRLEERALSPRSHMTRERRSDRPDLSALNQIVEIDFKRGVAWVEPGVTMEQLVDATVPFGWVPQVVTEFRKMSVGGAIMGCALESSSHRYGQFHDTAIEYELLLTDGEVVRVGLEWDADLFHALSGSYGTLGWITLAAIRLRPATMALQLRTTLLTDRSELIQRLTSSEADYLDGVALGGERYAVMEGCFDGKGGAPSRSGWSERWFIQKLLQRRRSGVESIGLKEYLFRYDRGAFWMAAPLLSPGGLKQLWLWWRRDPRVGAALKSHPPCPSLLFRLFLGWVASSELLYRQLHRLPQAVIQSRFLIQDCYLPIESALPFLAWSEEKLRLTPIWLCPVRPTTTPQILSPTRIDSSLLINIGLYAVPEGSATHLTRLVDERVAAFGGRKMLYGHSSYTEEEFWQLYDREAYEWVRGQLKATTLMDFYSKIAPGEKAPRLEVASER